VCFRTRPSPVSTRRKSWRRPSVTWRSFRLGRSRDATPTSTPKKPTRPGSGTARERPSVTWRSPGPWVPTRSGNCRRGYAILRRAIIWQRIIRVPPSTTPRGHHPRLRNITTPPARRLLRAPASPWHHFRRCPSRETPSRPCSTPASSVFRSRLRWTSVASAASPSRLPWPEVGAPSAQAAAAASVAAVTSSPLVRATPSCLWVKIVWKVTSNHRTLVPSTLLWRKKSHGDRGDVIDKTRVTQEVHLTVCCDCYILSLQDMCEL